MKNQKDKLCIAFAGSGPYAEPIFESLAKSFGNLTLITKKNEPKGQNVKTTKPTVKVLSKLKNIPAFEIDGKSDLLEVVKKIKPDLVVVSSLGIIITEKTLQIPKYGFINIHYSLLPAHRGTSPVQTTILNGDKKTGFVIQKVAKGVDEGDILYQYAITLSGSETSVTLRSKLLNIAAEKIEAIVLDYIQGKIVPKPQDNTKATYSKIISKADGRIGWKKSAETINRMVKAYTPWPGTYTFWNGKMLKILETEAVKRQSPGKKIGTFCEISDSMQNQDDKQFGVQTGNGMLVIKKLQLEGKKPLKTSDFILGNSDIIGEVLV